MGPGTDIQKLQSILTVEGKDLFLFYKYISGFQTFLRISCVMYLAFLFLIPFDNLTNVWLASDAVVVFFFFFFFFSFLLSIVFMFYVNECPDTC